MRRRGYRDTPLIITEYGSLLPYCGLDDLYYDSQGNPFDEARARGFMESGFDLLLTATDPHTGYAPDQNCLVQRWLWYSLDDEAYGGQLFGGCSRDPTSLGIAVGAYTGAIPPNVDLLAVEVRQVGPVPFSPTEPATVTLKARVSNVGNVAIHEPVDVRFLDGQGQAFGSDQVIAAPLPGCAATQAVTVTWPYVASGAHPVQVLVDPEDAITELDKTNNLAYAVALVSEHRVFLPLTMRQAAGQ